MVDLNLTTELTIPSDLGAKLRATLLKSGVFHDDNVLRSLFTTPQLIHWRDQLPHANSPADRVDLVVDFLREQVTLQNENSLIVFLRTLSERFDQNDTLHRELLVLAYALQNQQLSSLLKTPKTNFPKRRKVSFGQHLRLYILRIQAYIKFIGPHRFAAIFAGIALFVGLFTIALVPSLQTTVWKKIDSDISQANISDFSSDRLMIRKIPGQEVYTQTQLLSSDAYPTAIDIHIRQGMFIYVGSYGAGLYISAEETAWRMLGLENMVITQVIVDEDNPYSILAATNVGIFSTNDGGETWVNLGPIQSLVTTLAQHSTDSRILLAGTPNGVYRSTDHGKTWVGPELAGAEITGVVFAPTNSRVAYMACLYGAVYRSDNGGETWNLIRYPDRQGYPPLAVHPEDPNTIYLGPANKGLVRSTDGGITWESLGLQGYSISAILVPSLSPHAIFVGTDDESGLFVSWNNGNTWQNYGTLRDRILALIQYPNEPGVVLATTPKHGLLKIRDGGRSWLELGLERPRLATGITIEAFFPDPQNPDHLFSVPALEPGILESWDAGQSWSTAFHDSDLMKTKFNRLMIMPNDPNYMFLSAVGGEVYASSDGGETWLNLTANLPLGGYAPVVMASDGTLFAGPANRGVWKRDTATQLWSQTGLGVGVIEDMWLEVTDTSLLLFALDDKGRLYRSADQGAAWAAFDHIFRVVSSDPIQTGHLIGVLEDRSIVTSNDAGDSWQSVGVLPEATYPQLAVALDKPGHYIITFGEIALRTIDFGQTWAEVPLPAASLSGYSTPVLYVGARSRLYLLAYDNLHFSNDFGDSWQFSQIETTISFTDLQRFDQETWLAGTLQAGLFISKDNGETWTQTSLGEGYRILMFEVNEKTGKAVVLVETPDDIFIASSQDLSTWHKQTLPCQGRSSAAYAERITGVDQPQWQVVCSEPKTLLVIDPYKIGVTQIRLPSNEVVKDALYLLNGVTFIQTPTDRVFQSTNKGQTWQYAADLKGTNLHLSNMIIDNGVLYGTGEGLVNMLLGPLQRRLPGIYLTFGLLCWMWASLMLSPGFLRNNFQALKQLLGISKTPHTFALHPKLRRGILPILAFNYLIFASQTLTLEAPLYDWLWDLPKKSWLVGDFVNSIGRVLSFSYDLIFSLFWGVALVVLLFTVTLNVAVRTAANLSVIGRRKVQVLPLDSLATINLLIAVFGLLLFTLTSIVLAPKVSVEAIKSFYLTLSIALMIGINLRILKTHCNLSELYLVGSFMVIALIVVGGWSLVIDKVYFGFLYPVLGLRIPTNIDTYRGMLNRYIIQSVLIYFTVERLINMDLAKDIRKIIDLNTEQTEAE